ncbi:hypothetical protein WR25_26559 isoform A [Diploscapter pachys]|uniref:Uncharacterized protein n=1 Tax=Diploscapter pachys TaxID=2018661 RepID=A0A2A2LSK4_9BILA|nr:hypothetical protein WR25_26559 isoform A [Diploscapter pachys]
MLFMNTRPLDELNQVERRPSKSPSQAAAETSSKMQMKRLAMCLLLFYLLVSIFPCIINYPVSLMALIVPVAAIILALCKMKDGSGTDTWPFTLIAVFGILLKIASVIAYIMIFPSKTDENLKARQQGGRDANSSNLAAHKIYFFIILLFIELFILLMGLCLKWHLLAFDNDKKSRNHKRLDSS